MTDAATKDDLRQLEQRLDARVGARVHDLEAQLEGRFAAVDVRFAQVDARFTGLEARIGDLETRIDGRFARLDLRVAELASRVEAGLDRSIGALTRTLVLGLVGSLAATASLCLGAVALTS
jgi:hypothetical protein